MEKRSGGTRKAVFWVWLVHFLVSACGLYVFFTQCTETYRLPVPVCTLVHLIAFAFGPLVLVLLPITTAVGVTVMHAFDGVGPLPDGVIVNIPVASEILTVALSSLLWALAIVGLHRLVAGRGARR